MGVKARVSVLEGLIADILASTHMVGHEQSLMFTGAVEEIGPYRNTITAPPSEGFSTAARFREIVAEARRWCGHI